MKAITVRAVFEFIETVMVSDNYDVNLVNDDELLDLADMNYDGYVRDVEVMER